MDLEEKIRFAMSTVRPMAIYTLPYLTQVLGSNDRLTGELVGSGLFCMLRGRRTVITAGHVIAKGLTRFRYLAISAGNAAQPLLIEGVIRGNSDIDLATCDLPDDFLLQDDKACWPEDRIDTATDKLSTDYLFVHGFPGVRSQSMKLPIESRVVSKSLPYGVMQRLEPLSVPLQPYQFAMDFDLTNCQTESGEPEDLLFDETDESAGPRGLSGSPVWRIGASGRKAAEWSPARAELVGVITAWLPAERVLVATKASRALDLISNTPPGTKYT